MGAKDICSLELIEEELSQVKQEYLRTCRQKSSVWLTLDELEARASAAESNVSLLERAIVLWTRKAQLFGYENYMQMTMRDNLIKSPAIVQDLLDNLEKQLSPLKNHLCKRWRELKGEESEDRGEEDDGKFYEWDRHYFTQKMVEESYDSTQMMIFKDVFGIAFAEIDDQNVEFLTNGEGRQSLTWHPDVLVFAVWEAPQGNIDEQSFLGYLYMDLLCRSGKRSGFCDLFINPGFSDEKGNRVFPSTCLLCNFDKPKENSHRYLQHHEVVVLFHELGHGIHDLVAKTEFALFHGASTAEDFNEAPSHMLEHWCWHPKERSMLDHLIEKLLHSRRTKRRCQDPRNAEHTTEQFHSMMNQTLGMDHPGVFCPAQACMPEHFTVEGLYKYLITQIYASDMFSTDLEKDPRVGKAGLRYRRTILENGSGRDEMQMMVDFLGRPPDPEAFLAHLGPIGHFDGKEGSSP
ncbi:hypothetical protein KC354_g5185 [Hortaea werneckii]|nr:hypothetical protein KC354_g5185 [Hortaea werneckii]